LLALNGTGTDYYSSVALRRVDVLLWGEKHFYGSPTCEQYFGCEAYDPEGTLGALTASVMAFEGLLAGRVIVAHSSHRERLRRWAAYGVLFLSIGLALCGGIPNDGPFPVNKNLWSPSFVFVLGGGGFLMLAVCYILIDMPSPLRVWSGMPLFPLGMNSILIYSCHEIFWDAFPIYWWHANTHAQILGCNLCGILTWLLIAWLLHKRGLYWNL
jgi:heparan-alpha-glucosaminide N-acetyltransferase